ncbi:DUF5004 domain-containing protein [Flavobacterium pallidum]|nr:DUF5004 domain-containing protein [Flavobacterium pallidum]
MKIKIIAFSIVTLAVLSSSKMIPPQQGISQQLIGTWKWNAFINTKIGQTLSIEVFSQMAVKEMKTEFRSDNTYTESKLKKGSTEFTTLEGTWKVENEATLSMKEKGDWRAAKIVKFANDSLVLEIAPQVNLLMVRENKIPGLLNVKPTNEKH